MEILFNVQDTAVSNVQCWRCLCRKDFVFFSPAVWCIGGHWGQFEVHWPDRLFRNLFPAFPSDWLSYERAGRKNLGGFGGCTVHCTRWLLDTWLRKTKLLIKSMESPCLCIWKSNLLLCRLLTYNQKLLPFSVRCQALYTYMYTLVIIPMNSTSSFAGATR